MYHHIKRNHFNFALVISLALNRDFNELHIMAHLMSSKLLFIQAEYPQELIT